MGLATSTGSTPASSTTTRQGPATWQQWWINAWRPTNTEAGYRITEIEGEVPRELHGTLFRNGPSQKILPAEGYGALHLFDGDGLVHAFRFDDGAVSYRGRFVEHPTYLREQAEGRYCMNGVGVQVADPVEPFRVQPNTNVVYHHGKLMALVENSWPTVMDARTLETNGVMFGFDGQQLGMSVTAHPKIDGKTGQMIIHGYQPFEPYLQLYVVEPDGRCSLAETIDAPYAVMAHDVAITENYVIFIWPPAYFDGMKIAEGGSFNESVRWEPERGLLFGIRRREAGAKTQWFTAPSPGFIFHPGNAYEEDGKIYMDACTYPEGGALLQALSGFRSATIPEGFYAVPFLYEFDLASGECRERQLDDRGVEFPRIDDRLVGHKNRYGYAAMSRRGNAMVDTWANIVRYDRQGGRSVVHDFGKWQWPSEPVFVPRSSDAAEDDGFVLCTVYDGITDGSYLAVLDARNMDAKPLAKCHLQHRIPLGFHGNFAPGIV